MPLMFAFMIVMNAAAQLIPVHSVRNRVETGQRICSWPSGVRLTRARLLLNLTKKETSARKDARLVAVRRRRNAPDHSGFERSTWIQIGNPADEMIIGKIDPITYSNEQNEHSNRKCEPPAGA